jgi:hypothetical protein
VPINPGTVNSGLYFQEHIYFICNKISNAQLFIADSPLLGHWIASKRDRKTGLLSVPTCVFPEDGRKWSAKSKHVRHKSSFQLLICLYLSLSYFFFYSAVNYIRISSFCWIKETQKQQWSKYNWACLQLGQNTMKSETSSRPKQNIPGDVLVYSKMWFRN